jgi:dihydrofolate reductase
MDILVINHVTLDGVMQGPGRPDEDTRDGFTKGGWATARSDVVVGQALGRHLASSAGLLLGRRTYDDLLSHWNKESDNPFAGPLNAAQKYVVTSSTDEPTWPNTTFLNDDPIGRVRGLRASGAGTLHVMGSGQLLERLFEEGLIDGLVLLIHPIVLGSGHRLFDHGTPSTTFALEGTVTAPSGVIVATYRSAGDSGA